MGVPPSSPGAESRALALSMAGSGLLGAIGVAWGAVTGSQIVLFDGVVTLAGIVLVAVSVVAARIASSRTTADYPYGRHAAAPLAVAIQGAALLGALAYGASDAVTVILAGGSEPTGLAVAIYGTAATLACLALARLLASFAGTSALSRAELVSWRSGAALSAVVGAGGIAAMLLAASGRSSMAGHLDPCSCCSPPSPSRRWPWASCARAVGSCSRRPLRSRSPQRSPPPPRRSAPPVASLRRSCAPRSWADGCTPSSGSCCLPIPPVPTAAAASPTGSSPRRTSSATSWTIVSPSSSRTSTSSRA